MPNVFSPYHPAVAFSYLACAIAFSMAAMQPVYLGLSCIAAFACSGLCRGWRAAFASLPWIVGMWLIVAAANVAFSASGSTELFRIGTRAFYLESLAYGLCAGCMLSCVLLWFSSYAACMGSENSMALFGNFAPAVSLMVSQVMRLVPQFIARGRDISAVQDAASAAASRSKKDVAEGRMRVVSVLMGWGMEDGLARSDAMRARGYGCGIRRSAYRRYRLGRADAAALVGILALAAVNVPLAVTACSQYSFYPALSVPVPWWGYAVYAAFLAVPVAMHAKEWWRWRTCS